MMRTALSLVSAMAVVLLATRAAAAGASGYALPGDAQAAKTLPTAYPPGLLNQFDRDIDLPETDHYLNEVLRYVPGGLRNSVVAQFAVIRPGEPVQVMLVRVQNVARGRWRVASRVFGALDWPGYLALREGALRVVLAQPPAPGASAIAGGLELCADGGSGELGFSSPVTHIAAARGGCSDEVFRVGQQMIRTAEDAVGAR